MKNATFAGTLARFGLVAILAIVVVGRAEPQDPNLKPGYGVITLRAGFTPDPIEKKLEAGGPVETNQGNLKAYVAQEPDVLVNYTAGGFPLTFYAQSNADTTLHILAPDGKWYANDDGPNTGLNPLVKFARPSSGKYFIWVGTLEKGDTPPAKLFITELK